MYQPSFVSMKKSRKNQLLEKFLMYFLTAITCSLLLSGPFWIPSLCSSIKFFLFVSLPNLGLLLFAPKVLFIVGNLIVLFLVGESKFFASSGDAYYDEYVRKSQSPKNGSSDVGDNYMKIAKAEKRIEHTEERSYRDGDACIIEKSLVRADYQIQMHSGIFVDHDHDPEHKEKRIQTRENHSNYFVNRYYDLEHEAKRIETRENLEFEKEKKDSDEGDHDFDFPAEELSKRADDFIARVNSQRRLEARLLLSGGELER